MRSSGLEGAGVLAYGHNMWGREAEPAVGGHSIALSPCNCCLITGK